MPQRNGQNPIRAVRNYGQGSRFSDTAGTPHHADGAAAICPSCKTAVPPRPGFRISALKCPKCGTSLGKK